MIKQSLQMEDAVIYIAFGAFIVFVAASICYQKPILRALRRATRRLDRTTKHLRGQRDAPHNSHVRAYTSRLKHVP